ncbi:MAG TPA: energy transducer TonB [Puia sp.]|jgi:protein TonB|nr:energy transducer TonB [Puia sp.]
MKLLLSTLFLLALAAAGSATAQKTDISYPGGDTAWLRYLNHTLRYPDDAVNKEIMGTVIVSFTVNADSTISDIQAISGPKKGGLREEAVRVITLSKKWVPATENGVPLKSATKQPIVFKLVRA